MEQWNYRGARWYSCLSQEGKGSQGALLLSSCMCSWSLALKHCRRNIAFSIKMELLSTLISCKNGHRVRRHGIRKGNTPQSVRLPKEHGRHRDMEFTTRL